MRKRRLPGQPFLDWLNRLNRRRRGKGFDDRGVPVEPNNPKNLSGGAEAPLEFDD